MGSSQEPFGESRLPEGSGNIARSHEAEEKKKKPGKMTRYIVLVEGKMLHIMITITSYGQKHSILDSTADTPFEIQETAILIFRITMF